MLSGLWQRHLPWGVRTPADLSPKERTVPAPATRILRIAVDLIIELDDDRLVLIRRRNPPHGWALPGGFLEYGESLEHAAVREAKEETGLDITLVRQFHTYSDPARDPRGHTVATVFIARAQGTPCAGDDAGAVRVVPLANLPRPLAFDHDQILAGLTCAAGAAGVRREGASPP
jgi:8-oxo-dGTP diphosphatase